MTTAPLFLIDELPDDDTVVLTGDEGRHAAKVRRLRPGESVQLGDGRGTVLDCRVATVRTDGLLLEIHARHHVARREPRLVVVQALAKGDRGELAVEAMTELGVDEIVPWAAHRSIVEWTGPRGDRALERWRRTAREASKQSRRPWLPEIAPAADDGAVRARLQAGFGVVLHESARAPLTEIELPRGGEVVVVVGPEGGITDGELEQFAAAGATPVRLGPSVLRTSTAGAAALAVLSTRLGRWG